MIYKRLYLFIEGPDDDRFFKSPVIKRIFLKNYDCVINVPYVGQSSSWLKKFIEPLKYRQDASYIFVRDIDSSECVTNKKAELIAQYDFLEPEKILIVAKEIESWYLAGLDDKTCQTLGIKYVGNTDKVTKETLDEIIVDSFDSQNEFMIEVLKYYSIQTARVNNTSFNYLLKPSTEAKFVL